MTLADFQQKTADRIVDVFRGGQLRVLLADEVGLGKTIVARAVIKQVGDWHRDVLNDDHFKVVYICSNISIASQNAQKLGIKDQMNISESRLSMQHLNIFKQEIMFILAELFIQQGMLPIKECMNLLKKGRNYP